MEKRAMFAVCGLGFIFPRHKESIKKIGGEIKLTCDIDKSKKADFTSWKEMMKSEIWKDITHVSLCVPNCLHYEMAMAMRDKIVLSEKPLTLSSEEVLKLPDNVFTVLQLRHHPEVVKLKKKLKGNHKVKLVVKVKRDESYWDGWKGDEKKSGGILFNLGIHYFDLLIHLFGNEYRVLNSRYSPKKANGQIYFNGTIVDYDLEIMSSDNGQDRKLEIDGEEVSLSKKDNLSFEGLHTEVYKELLKGKGIKPEEAIKSILLVEKLKN